jgi:glycosyltransferase involved in cell wall biosynthesis
MHLTVGSDVLIGDNPEAFADAVARAYSDRNLWHVLADGGRENVRRYFSRAGALRTISRLLALTSEHRARKPDAVLPA